jgi:hypothetical protein
MQPRDLQFSGPFLEVFSTECSGVICGFPYLPTNGLGDRISRGAVYFCARSKRLLTSSQFTVPHQAAR